MSRQKIIDELDRRREVLYRHVGDRATRNDWDDRQAQLAVETLRTLDDIRTALEASKIAPLSR